MSSLPKKMGEDDSTTNVGDSRLRIFNAYHKKNFEHFVEDEEDNIKFL